MNKKYALLILVSISFWGSLSAQMAMPEAVLRSRESVKARHVPASTWTQPVQGTSAESPSSESRTLAPESFSMRLSPNPTMEEARLDLLMPHPSAVLVELYDRGGSLVRRVYQGYIAESGQWGYPIHLGGLASGIYYVRLRLGEELHTLPLVKL